jgi:capsular polysaccharide transport system permease protein
MEIRPAQRPKVRSFRFFRSYSALILREMATSYGRSPGGYLWAVLEPLAGLALMTFVFSLMLRKPGLGHNFMYFYASGVLPFQLYSQLSSTLAASIRFSRPLLEYPAVSFMDAMLARFTLNAVTHILVMFLVIGGIILFYGLRPMLDWGAIFMSLAMAMALAVGVGTLNCYLVSAYPLWERIWAVMNRPLFIISGVFFLPDQVPQPVRDYLLYNPILHVVGELRRGMFPTYDAVYVSPVYVFSLSMGLTIFGLLFLLRYHKDLILK